MEKTPSDKSDVITLTPEDVWEVDRLAMLIEVPKSNDAQSRESLSEDNTLGEIYHAPGIKCHYRVDSAENLKLKPGRICINPPPENGRCDCCGRHISELNPFGNAGDPLVGNFEGALLIKDFRTFAPYDERAVLAMDEACEFYEADGYADPEDWLINKYGKDEGSRLYLSVVACTSTFPSWECRDCIVLNEDEYYAKLSMKEKGCPEK